MRPYEFDRSFSFRVTPAEFWATISNVPDFPRWWTWLREFDGTALQEGETARCAIRAPLPYWLRFEVDVARVVPEQRVDARVHGDISGPARLEIARARDGSCTVRLVWSLTVHDRVLTVGSHIARPLLEWGHERIVRQGLEQFETAALSAR